MLSPHLFDRKLVFSKPSFVNYLQYRTVQYKSKTPGATQNGHIPNTIQLSFELVLAV
jgi:hypothetical protein